MNTLYHNYFISNFFEPSRLVGIGTPDSLERGGHNPKTKEGLKPATTKKPVTSKEAIKKADEAMLAIAKHNVDEIEKGRGLIKTQKELDSFLGKLAIKGHKLKESNKKISDKYFELVADGHANWAFYKNKDKTKKGEVAGVREGEVLTRTDIENKRTKLISVHDDKIARLRKSTKNNKEFRKEVSKLAEEYKKTKKSADKGLKSIYERLIASCEKIKRVDLMRRIAIPPKLVEEVKSKLTKQKVSTFLGGIEGKNYVQKRARFKTAFLPNNQKGAILLTMAMQKALGFKGGAIDGKIGDNTIARLKKLFKPQSKAKVAQGQELTDGNANEKLNKKQKDSYKYNLAQISGIEDIGLLGFPNPDEATVEDAESLYNLYMSFKEEKGGAKTAAAPVTAPQEPLEPVNKEWASIKYQNDKINTKVNVKNMKAEIRTAYDDLLEGVGILKKERATGVFNKKSKAIKDAYKVYFDLNTTYKDLKVKDKKPDMLDSEKDIKNTKADLSRVKNERWNAITKLEKTIWIELKGKQKKLGTWLNNHDMELSKLDTIKIKNAKKSFKGVLKKGKTKVFDNFASMTQGCNEKKLSTYLKSFEADKKAEALKEVNEQIMCKNGEDFLAFVEREKLNSDMA